MLQYFPRAAIVASLTLVAGLAMARPELATPPQNDIKLRTEPAVVAAPELSPATVLAAVTLLVGGLLVVRGRKARG
jgi:hypothetical protein